ncbi:MAG: hypothetical protein U9Q22_02030 [Candidatus Altiarchaeota archaeon]|nr:hypothetical protein [Candidatus Altiarchaeota archaeon]
MNFIKEIFLGDPGQDYIHQKFIRYGKGEFLGPIISLKKTSRIKVNGSVDYVNILGELILKNSGGDVKVSGSIFSRKEINSELIPKSRKMKGFFNSELKDELPSSELLKLYEEFKDSYFLLDLESQGFKLKTKKKPPKPGSKINDKFFTAVLDNTLLDRIMDEICFDYSNKDFREIKISHTYHINELVVPEEYMNDAAKARILAKRKGSIKRIASVDDSAYEIEKELLA